MYSRRGVEDYHCGVPVRIILQRGLREDFHTLDQVGIVSLEDLREFPLTHPLQHIANLHHHMLFAYHREVVALHLYVGQLAEEVGDGAPRG